VYGLPVLDDQVEERALADAVEVFARIRDPPQPMAVPELPEETESVLVPYEEAPSE